MVQSLEQESCFLMSNHMFYYPV